jgi:hypothetical protein
MEHCAAGPILVGLLSTSAGFQLAQLVRPVGLGLVGQRETGELL